jgi:hypothetical protein
MKRSIVFLTLLLLTPLSHAQFFTGPEASACGGSGRAGIDLGEAAFLNPAAVAFVQRYNVSAMLGVSDHPVNGTGSELAASIVDGTSDAMINGALTFVRRRTETPLGISNTQQDWQGSIAGFLHRKLAIGLAAHRRSDEMYTPQGAREYAQWNGHFGALYVPIPSVGIGFVAYDLVPGEELPLAVRVVPTMALGVNYIYEKFFRARMDFVRPDTENPGRKTNVMAGFETFLMDQFALRTGAYWRETHDQTYFTMGMGFSGPRLSIDYSFQKDIRIAGNSRHLIDLWLPF